MKIPYYAGWAVLMTAFAVAAAEVLVKPLRGGSQVFIAAHDLWYTVWPGSILVLQIKLEAIWPALWDPLALAVLSLPAWVLLGIPGFVLIGLFRPHKPSDDEEREEARRYEEQIMLYEELARQAEAEGIPRDGADMMPDHSALEAMQRAHAEGLEDEDAVADFIRQAGIEPRPRGVSSVPEVRLENLSDRADDDGPPTPKE